MSFETTLYDAFTGMNPAEKSAVINFLCTYTAHASKPGVREAVEYAIKNKPSFGGFVLTAHTGRQLIAAVVVNRTGMEGYNPNNLFVYVTFHEDYCQDEPTMLQVLKKAIDLTDGDIALHVEPSNPILKLYKKMGFEAPYLELRFNKQQPAAVA
jgi:hypothetical protein